VTAVGRMPGHGPLSQSEGPFGGLGYCKRDLFPSGARRSAAPPNGTEGCTTEAAQTKEDRERRRELVYELLNHMVRNIKSNNHHLPNFLAFSLYFSPTPSRAEALSLCLSLSRSQTCQGSVYDWITLATSDWSLSQTLSLFPMFLRVCFHAQCSLSRCCSLGKLVSKTV